MLSYLILFSILLLLLASRPGPAILVLFLLRLFLLIFFLFLLLLLVHRGKVPVFVRQGNGGNGSLRRRKQSGKEGVLLIVLLETESCALVPS